jgi:hypothetical protein
MTLCIILRRRGGGYGLLWKLKTLALCSGDVSIAISTLKIKMFLMNSRMVKITNRLHFSLQDSGLVGGSQLFGRTHCTHLQGYFQTAHWTYSLLRFSSRRMIWVTFCKALRDCWAPTQPRSKRNLYWRPKSHAHSTRSQPPSVLEVVPSNLQPRKHHAAVTSDPFSTNRLNGLPTN